MCIRDRYAPLFRKNGANDDPGNVRLLLQSIICWNEVQTLLKQPATRLLAFLIVNQRLEQSLSLIHI